MNKLHITLTEASTEESSDGSDESTRTSIEVDSISVIGMNVPSPGNSKVI